MEIVGQDKPSLEELRHFGVKGMKWGIRKGVGPEIRTARRNLRAERGKLRDQRKAIRKTERGSAQRTKEKKKYADMKVAYLNNPDRVTAVRMTRGEKAAIVLLSAPTITGLAGTAGYIAGASIHSRVIASRQRRGVYNKK